MPIKCSEYKVGLTVIKYAPILMGLIMYIHTILVLNGINLPIARTIAGSAIIPSIIIFATSNMLKFCYIHKSFTIYSFVADLCINYEHYFGFGEILRYIQIFIVIIGTILFSLLFCKLKLYHYRCCIIKSDSLKYLKQPIS